jgi:DNA-binding transcriptional LysR family regulator
MMPRTQRGRASRRRRNLYVVQRSELVTIVPGHAGRTYAAEHPVRLVALPISLEPLEVTLYARPEASRTPTQRWLVEFLHRYLAEPPARAQAR